MVIRNNPKIFLLVSLAALDVIVVAKQFLSGRHQVDTLGLLKTNFLFGVTSIGRVSAESWLQ